MVCTALPYMRGCTGGSSHAKSDHFVQVFGGLVRYSTSVHTIIKESLANGNSLRACIASGGLNLSSRVTLTRWTNGRIRCQLPTKLTEVLSWNDFRCHAATATAAEGLAAKRPQQTPMEMPHRCLSASSVVERHKASAAQWKILIHSVLGWIHCRADRRGVCVLELSLIHIWRCRRWP